VTESGKTIASTSASDAERAIPATRSSTATRPRSESFESSAASPGIGATGRVADSDASRA
jgi:hypothetical protein